MCCSIISLYSLQSPHKYIIINLALLSKRGSSILDHPVFLSFVFVLLFTDECVSFLINNVIINSTFFLPYYLRQYYLCAIKKTRITLHFYYYESALGENSLPIGGGIHSSEITGLCLIKFSSKTVQNLPQFLNNISFHVANFEEFAGTFFWAKTCYFWRVYV